MKHSTVLLTFLLGACTVGEVPAGDGGGSGSNADEINTCEPRATNIAPAHDHTAAPLGPRARTSCLDAGCHNAGGAGGQFSFAGTVYKETGGLTAVQGATIRIYKSGAKTPLAEAVTDNAGNFVIRQAGTFTDFPYITQVTACGLAGTVKGIRPMLSAINAGDANCNLGGTCHGNGGTQGAIYLED